MIREFCDICGREIKKDEPSWSIKSTLKKEHYDIQNLNKRKIYFGALCESCTLQICDKIREAKKIIKNVKGR